jgi:hypothetical protein
VWKNADPEYVECVVRWEGEPGKAYEALVACGFIDQGKGKSIVIHGWEDMNSSMVNAWRVGHLGGRPKKAKTAPRAPSDDGGLTSENDHENDPKTPPPNADFETSQEPDGNPEVSSRLTSDEKPDESGVTISKPNRKEGRKDSRITPIPPRGDFHHFEASMERSGGGGAETGSKSRQELAEIDAIWAIWPKKVDTLESQLAIGRAIGRHGFGVVLRGTRAISDAARQRGTSVIGWFLTRPVKFFDGDKFLDDPAFYGGRPVNDDPIALRQRVRELTQFLAEHPGNPDNGVGSHETKEKQLPAFKKLREELKQTREKLSAMEVMA